MADAPQEKARRRWLRITPDRVVVAVLALEGFLLASAWFRWFAFNEHKGYAVLICLATVGAALVLMFFWFLAALVFRLRFQFSILALLVLVVVVAVPFSWLATEMSEARKQREAVTAIEKAGGEVVYDLQVDPSSDSRMAGAEPPGPPWLRRLLGNDLLGTVTFVNLAGVGASDARLEHLTRLTQLQWLWLSDTNVSDAGLEHLKGLTQLQSLGLERTKVTDLGLQHLKGLSHLRTLDLGDTAVGNAGLEHLKGLTQLRDLTLSGTKVSDAGVMKLQQALPNCQILR